MYAIKSDGSWRCVEADWPLESDETLHEDVPAWALLKQAKRAKLADLESACNTQLTSGFAHAGYFYPSTLDDQVNLQSTKTDALETNSAVPFICTEIATGEKGVKWHAPDEILAVYTTGKNIKLGLFQTLGQKQQAVRDADTLEDVAAITW